MRRLPTRRGDSRRDPTRGNANAGGYKKEVEHRDLYLADNLDVINGIEDDTFDLIYVDQPYDQNAAQSLSWEQRYLLENKHDDLWSVAELVAQRYDQRLGNYIAALAYRLLMMKRIMKPTGSLYLYCDLHSARYVERCLNAIFGEGRNVFAAKHDTTGKDIQWCRPPQEGLDRAASDQHGVLFAYAKSDIYTYDPDRARVPEMLEERLEIVIAEEEMGAAGQQPVVLLKHIISAATKPDDFILDPFVGAGTTCLAAEDLGRRWVAIDRDEQAIDTTRCRLRDIVPLAKSVPESRRPVRSGRVEPYADTEDGAAEPDSGSTARGEEK